MRVKYYGSNTYLHKNITTINEIYITQKELEVKKHKYF